MTDRQRHIHIYWAWKAMKQRCQNPKCHSYQNYGARGITVCDEWQEFEPFLEWALANGHQEGLAIDRADNNKGYNPNNCHWVTPRENANNRRVTSFITVNGECLPETVWAEKIGVRRGTVKNWRMKHGSEYTANRIADILKNGYVENDFGYSHRRAVRHVETGLTFDSVRTAAKHFNVAPCSISNSMRNKRAMRVGTFEWEVK